MSKRIPWISKKDGNCPNEGDSSVISKLPFKFKISRHSKDARKSVKKIKIDRQINPIESRNGTLSQYQLNQGARNIFQKVTFFFPNNFRQKLVLGWRFECFSN